MLVVFCKILEEPARAAAHNLLHGEYRTPDITRVDRRLSHKRDALRNGENNARYEEHPGRGRISDFSRNTDLYL